MSEQRPDHDADRESDHDGAGGGDLDGAGSPGGATHLAADLEWDLDAGVDDEPEPWVADVADGEAAAAPPPDASAWEIDAGSREIGGSAGGSGAWTGHDTPGTPDDSGAWTGHDTPGTPDDGAWTSDAEPWSSDGGPWTSDAVPSASDAGSPAGAPGDDHDDDLAWASGALGDRDEAGESLDADEPEPWRATAEADDDAASPWHVSYDASDDDPAPWSSSPAADEPEPRRIDISDLGEEFDLAALEAAVVEMGLDDLGIADLESDTPDTSGDRPAAEDRGAGGLDAEPAPRTALGDQLTEPMRSQPDRSEEERGAPDTTAPPASDPSADAPPAPEPGRVDLTNFTAKGGSGAAGGRGKVRRRLFGR